jgi:hypothetical protein
MTVHEQPHEQLSPIPVPRAAEPAPDATAAVVADELLVRIQHLHRGIERVADELVIGPHGQNLTVRAARAKERQLTARIEMEQVTGSLRHHQVRPLSRLLATVTVAVVDFPIMLWLTSSVFNVDWAHPLRVPLVISAVVSLLATGGAAVALVHLGHNQRQHKNDRRQLDWRALSAGGKASLATVGLLVGLMGVLMFVRVDTEGVLSGLADLAALLAVLVAVVLVVSALLVFWTAFRDGSLELDELRHYSTCVRPHLERRRVWEDKVAELTCQYDLLCRLVERERPA